MQTITTAHRRDRVAGAGGGVLDSIAGGGVACTGGAPVVAGVASGTRFKADSTDCRNSCRLSGLVRTLANRLASSGWSRSRNG